jgi:acetolactate synthase-1/2/3 large subunit
MKLSDYVVGFVADLGVKHVFVVTGGGAMHLNDSLARCERLEFICNHHEQACAIAAENYAKATNNLGVAMVTTGPGGTNAITGLAGAFLDSTPCLFLSGQVKRADRMFSADGTPLGVRQRGPQELDIISVVRPLTKYAVTVTDPASIRYHLEKAVHLALSGRPGPVWIDLPLDIQASSIDEESLAGFQPEPAPANDGQLREQVRRVIEKFNSSRRPFLLLGNGVRLAHAEKEFRELATLLDAPVGTTWVAMDLFGEENALCMGRPGTLAPRGANFAMQNSDFLLTIGARMDVPVAGWNPHELARGAYKVMVDVDAAELRKLSDVVQMPVCIDAGNFLREMLAQKSSIAASDRRDWKARCEDWKARYPIIHAEHRQNGPVSIYHLAEVISQAVRPEDQIVSGSSGIGIEIFLVAYPSKTGQRIFHTAGLGAMGYGIAASIGVSLATGRSRTICVKGDGGFQMNIQELATIAHHRLPLKFFVLNNGGYAAIRGSQNSFFGGANIGCDPKTGLTLPDVCEVARAYGLSTARIEDQTDLLGQVKRVLDMPGPVVCDVRVLAEEARAPRVTSIQLPNGSIKSKPLEDLWPFLDRDEFRMNMIVEPLESSDV